MPGLNKIIIGPTCLETCVLLGGTVRAPLRWLGEEECVDGLPCKSFFWLTMRTGSLISRISSSAAAEGHPSWMAHAREANVM
eukprot:SAG25_NODE_484_length_7474_cov_11.267823_9_plen_82_part_00